MNIKRSTTTLFEYFKLAIIIQFCILLAGCPFDTSDENKEETPNLPLMVSISNDFESDELSTVSLVATVSGGVGAVNFLWTQTEGEPVSLQNSATTSASFSAPEVENDQTLVFTFTATDSEGQSLNDTVTVTIKNVVNNSPPTVTAGNNLSVMEGQTVQLTAVASDQEGEITILWEQIDGPQVVLTDSSVTNPTFIAPNISSQSVTLTFKITVTDLEGLTATDEMSVEISKTQSITFPVGNWRLVREKWDYDLNGVFEEIREFDFDELGRIENLTSQYIDDGQVDSEYARYPYFRLYSTTNANIVLDSENRVQEFTTQLDNSLSKITYIYEKDLRVISAQMVFNNENTEFKDVVWETVPNYEGDFIQGYSLTDTSDSLEKFKIVINYDINNVVESWETTNSAGLNSEFVSLFTLSRDNGLISEIRETSLTDTFTANTYFAYENGLVSDETFNSDLVLTDYKYTYEYEDGRLVRASWDTNNDGLVDTVTEYDWEQVPCIQIPVWVPNFAVNLADLNQNVPLETQIGTGWSWNKMCQMLD